MKEFIILVLVLVSSWLAFDSLSQRVSLKNVKAALEETRKQGTAQQQTAQSTEVTQQVFELREQIQKLTAERDESRRQVANLTAAQPAPSTPSWISKRVQESNHKLEPPPSAVPNSYSRDSNGIRHRN